MGTIVGDAIGLPYEALSGRRGRRLLGPPDRHRFLFGRGMMSDDGEHACMVAQALCISAGEPEAFRRALAWRLRWWVLAVPAGAGGATLRASLKLWLGFPPNRSGVFSAGNGPAMRAAVLGAAVHDPNQLKQLIDASTRLTHTDPKAFHGAMAVAIHAWFRHPRDFRSAVRAAVECGGDTDTVAAITGGIVASGTGPEGVPADWSHGMLEWPRSAAWIEQLAAGAESAVDSRRPVAPPRVGPTVLGRNIIFFAAVLAHLCRRALPPY